MLDMNSGQLEGHILPFLAPAQRLAVLHVSACGVYNVSKSVCRCP